MTDTPAIEVQNLHVGYGATPVLHGIDLAVAPGEFVAILGSSGCGKTTLLRTIAGFQKSVGRRASGSRAATSRTFRRRSAASRWCSSPTRCGRT